MFKHSNVLISGGTFLHQGQQNVLQYDTGKDSFDLLQKHVAPAAFHNSGERFDPPKCHPNTRVAVQRKIMDWIKGLDANTLNALIMWLYGPAGAGKSAIAQSIAELCFAEGYLLASFFFSRADPSRNHGRSLFATIAYQISTILPSTRERILAAIIRDPLIFTRSLSTQFSSLIVEPLQSLVDSGYFSEFNSPRLILIDGLDECLDRQVQRGILDIILDGLIRRHIPLTFLICSRPEYEISSVFSSPDVRGILTRVVLDDAYQPDDDIQLFLRDKFDSIKESHPMKRFIPSSWPTADVMESLVQKSSGQFIYASTVIKYVASPRHRPTERLNVILDLSPAGRDMPFAELDFLYTHILSCVEHIERVLEIIGFASVLGSSFRGVEKILCLDPGEVEILFCDLGSIVGQVENKKNKNSQLRILHASLLDFLNDPERSKNFFIDFNSKRTEYVARCLLFMSDHLQSSLELDSESMSIISWNIANAQPTQELQDAIQKFSLEPLYAAAIAKDAPVDPSNRFDLIQFQSSFLSYLRPTKFEGAEMLYSLKRKPFDQYLKHHLSKYYENDTLTFLMTVFNRPTRNRAQGHVPDTVYWLLGFLDQNSLGVDQNRLDIAYNHDSFEKEYCQLVAEFLDDPKLSGEYGLDGARFATAALCCLKYLCDHGGHNLPPPLTAKGSEVRRQLPWIWRKRKSNRLRRAKFLKTIRKKFDLETLFSECFYFALDCLPYLLSRAEKSEELVKFADHYIFAPRSFKFRRATKRAKLAITEYMERTDGEAWQADWRQHLNSRRDALRV